MAVEHRSSGNDDGTTFGQDTSDLISMYGVTPVVQHSSDASVDAMTALTAVSGGTAAFAFSTASALENLMQGVQDMRDALQAFGIMS